MISLPDVEDDEAGPSSTELSTTLLPPTSSTLQRTESNTSFLSRLNRRLRRSLHLSSNKREQSLKFLAGDEVAVNENVRPQSLYESREVWFLLYC